MVLQRDSKRIYRTVMKRLPALLVIFPLLAYAQLQVAKIYASNRVLQRDKPVQIRVKETTSP